MEIRPSTDLIACILAYSCLIDEKHQILPKNRLQSRFLDYFCGFIPEIRYFLPYISFIFPYLSLSSVISSYAV